MNPLPIYCESLRICHLCYTQCYKQNGGRVTQAIRKVTMPDGLTFLNLLSISICNVVCTSYYCYVLN